MSPYLLVSDLHAHAWSQFATIEAEGVNSRLGIILGELERAATAYKARYRDTGLIVIAGDLFHTRGSIDPEVFNPVHECIQRLLDEGFIFMAIPGNHDLKGKSTTELGNAMQTLGALKGFDVITKPSRLGRLAFVPWCASLAELRTAVATIAKSGFADECDLIIHAGIDGVIPGMPEHGLSAKEIPGWGFKRVFAGHYHNHKAFPDGVYSIGATTHQTWSDIHSKAGFLFVEEDKVIYQASRAPSFVEITGETDPDEVKITLQGNYVRVRDMTLTAAEVQTFRKELMGYGALGVSFQVAREVVSARGAVPVKVMTLEASIDLFLDKKLASEDPIMIASVKAYCNDILSNARSASL